MSVHGCLSLCGPVMDWRPVQGIPRLLLHDRWDRLQPPRDPTRSNISDSFKLCRKKNKINRINSKKPLTPSLVALWLSYASGNMLPFTLLMIKKCLHSYNSHYIFISVYISRPFKKFMYKIFQWYLVIKVFFLLPLVQVWARHLLPEVQARTKQIWSCDHSHYLHYIDTIWRRQPILLF